MKFGCSVEGIAEARAMVGSAFSLRRANAVLASGLTWTAQEIKQAEQAGLNADLDRPTPYTLRSLYMRKATATPLRLEAEVWMKDDFEGSGPVGTGRQVPQAGTPAARYLWPQVYGGSRFLKRFEYSLQQVGAMPKGWFAVPGRGARLDSFGNVSQGQITQILSQLRVQLLAGFERRLPPPGDPTSKRGRQANNKRRRAFGRAGGQIFAVPKQQGKLKPGIYLAEGRDFGARVGYGRSGKLTAIFIFKPTVHYQPRLRWFERAQTIVDTRLAANTARALSESLTRLQARGASAASDGAA